MPRSKDSTTTPKKAKGEKKKIGRPRKGAGPLINYNELDKLLVFGEVVPIEDAEGTMVRFPTYRELADRFKVSLSHIGDYASQHNCFKRRGEVQERIRVKAEQKIIEQRSTDIAVTKEHELKIIDSYVLQFEQALAEGRVRFDSPGDYNTMCRLKQFLTGGPDGRQEVSNFITLEQLQERYRKAQEVAKASPALRGEVVRSRALPGASAGRTTADAAPAHLDDGVLDLADRHGEGETQEPVRTGARAETAGKQADSPLAAPERSLPKGNLENAVPFQPAPFVPRWPTAAALAALTGMKPKREEEP